MGEVKFNLLEEPWILVEDFEERVHEVSIKELFANAGQFLRLAGESEVQNIAVLRFILAVLQTVTERYDLDGSPDQLESPNQALDRWAELWEQGHFDAEMFETYFDEWKDRFWLIHPERPILQALSAEKGTEYTTAKLIGNMSESSNKTRLFQSRSMAGKKEISLAEAARWLLYINGFDDTAAKPKGKAADGGKLPSCGAGWLGKLGLVYAEGSSLFETLLMNLILLNRNEKLWPSACPGWELEKPREAERVKIAVPDDLPALYTLSSRRLLLKTRGDTVVGYSLLGGDFFDSENAFIEPFTIWSRPKTRNKKGAPPVDIPRKYDAERQVWRYFSNFVGEKEADIETPGIIRWIRYLKNKGLIDRNYQVQLHTCSVQYGDKDFFVTDQTGDSLVLASSLIADTGDFRSAVEREIELIDQAARCAGNLRKDVMIASGVSGEDQEKAAYAKGAETFYRLLDDPFRRWLQSLDPARGGFTESQKSWREEVRKVERLCEHTLTKDAPVAASYGRLAGADDNKKIYSVPKAVHRYYGGLKKIYG